MLRRKFNTCKLCNSIVYAKKLCKYHYYKQLNAQTKQKKGKYSKYYKFKKKYQVGLYWYKKVRKEFFSKEENQLCKARVDGVCMIHATDIHHKAGRIGELLTNTSYFLPVCRACHRYIHDHSAWAEEQGFIIHL